jgi:divalent metal cation (Fe/Co/Zn/Cd) transporter
VIMITLSGLLAGYESIRRFLEPQPVANLLWVLIAGVIGFAGSELVLPCIGFVLDAGSDPLP